MATDFAHCRHFRVSHYHDVADVRKRASGNTLYICHAFDVITRILQEFPTAGTLRWIKDNIVISF